MFSATRRHGKGLKDLVRGGGKSVGLSYFSLSLISAFRNRSWASAKSFLASGAMFASVASRDRSAAFIAKFKLVVAIASQRAFALGALDRLAISRHAA
jgi:hypothetical protein